MCGHFHLSRKQHAAPVIIAEVLVAVTCNDGKHPGSFRIEPRGKTKNIRNLSAFANVKRQQTFNISKRLPTVANEPQLATGHTKPNKAEPTSPSIISANEELHAGLKDIKQELYVLFHMF